MTFECQCPERGQCPIHKRWMSVREHQMCQGVNVLEAVRNQYLSVWQKAAHETETPQTSRGIGNVVARAIRIATLGMVGPYSACQKYQAALNQVLPMGHSPLATVPIDREMLVKHLIWHLLPLGGALSWVWRKHAKKLREIAPTCNGRKVIAIGSPGRKDKWLYDSIDDVKRELDGLGFEFIEFQGRKAGEAASFLQMMSMIRTTDPNHVFLYGHSHGLTKPKQPDGSPCHIWIDLLWDTVACNAERAIEALEKKALAGSFTSDNVLKLRKLDVEWFYAGRFFWGRCASVFARNWMYVPRMYGGVEFWPGAHFKRHEVATLFHELPARLMLKTPAKKIPHFGQFFLHMRRGLSQRIRRCETIVRWLSHWLAKISLAKEPHSDLDNKLYDKDYLNNTVLPDHSRWEQSQRPITYHAETRTRRLHQPDWFYRSYQQIIADVHDWCDRLPHISAVSGIPRSGILPASLIAMRRNIPLVPIESLTGGFGPKKTTLRPINHPVGPVLVVDDTSWTGGSMRQQRVLLSGKQVIFGALYASQYQSEKLDTFGHPLSTPLHTFEYNFMRDALVRNFIIDFDGVLCDDWDGRNEDQHPEEYRAFLLSSPPKHFQPQFPVKAIVSGRLGKYRKESEQWLVNHGVRCRELILPFQTLEERSRGSIATEKARVYQRYPKATLFVESSASQAAEIFRMTGRPVFCTDTMTLWQ